MEVSKITKIAKALNIVEIVVTVAMFILFRSLNSVAKSIKTQEQLDNLLRVESISLFILGALSIVVIAMTAFLMTKNAKRVKGLGCLLASGIVTLVFAISGVMLGIVIWILSGISLKALKQKNAEEDFKAQLNLESQMSQENVSDEVDTASENSYE